jgi:glycine/D-amino acid oxidase-like deaminating enzyme
LKLKSSYALVSQPLHGFPGWNDRSVIWESARPYFYLRTTADNRILIGGADDEILDGDKRDRLIPRKTGILLNKLRQMFPEIAMEPDLCWAGTFGESRDALPYAMVPTEPTSP